MYTQTYLAAIRKRATAAVSAGASTFYDVCQRAAGAFPTDVLAALERSDSILSKLDPHYGSACPTRSSAFGPPEPHPLDSDWRFTPQSAAWIRQILITQKCRSVLCLGTGSVFDNLTQTGVTATLVEQNAALAQFYSADANSRHQIVITTVQEYDSEREFDAVVLDPPWYLSDIAYWLAKALASLGSGGIVVLPVFRELTRPRARWERVTLLRRLKAVGNPTIVGPISYATPTFELETLAANGTPLLDGWRIADLVTLRVPSTPAHHASPWLLPSRASHYSQHPWERYHLGRQVIAYRQLLGDDLITVEGVYPDGSSTLRTVSSRDPVRGEVNFWTSRNCALRVTGGPRVSRFLRLLTSASDQHRAVNLTSTNAAEMAALQRLTSLLHLPRADVHDNTL